MRNPRVRTTVSPLDDMRHPTDGSLRVYFRIGESALAEVRRGLHLAGAAAPRKILDLPSGFGRVLRYLRAAWPDAHIGAMELDQRAAAFCASRFGAVALASADPLWEQTDVDADHDLLWSGSLLTHFDAPAWPLALAYFRDRVQPGGVLVVTTHGERSIELLEQDPATVAEVRDRIAGWSGDYGVGDLRAQLATEARASGFAFSRYPWDPSSPYGVSFAEPAWVRRVAASVPGLRLVHHEPHGWFHHQDVWTFIRDDAPAPPP